jgi:acetyl-CoA C-acetyltransferase
MVSNEVFIAAAKRTPIGSLLGQFCNVSAVDLGATAIRAAIEAIDLDPFEIDEVIMGNVLTAGVGQAPARQAAMAAGIPPQAGATTINKVCGSGLKAIMLAHDAILAGSADVVIAGGMENMSLAPHLIQARGGIRFGDAILIEHLMHDGLNHPDSRVLGTFSQATADKYGFTREQQDNYAKETILRARTAMNTGQFANEIAPVQVEKHHGEWHMIDTDGMPFSVELEQFPLLKPAFTPTGTITAATASRFCDGAAAVVVLSAEAACRLGIVPLVRVVAHATHSQAPELFTTAPVGALRKLLKQTQWTVDDVDLFEINEAMAAVPMAVMAELGVPPEKINVHGGELALGHPIGASGARITATLIHAMLARGAKRGIATLCIEGGEAVAVAYEALPSLREWWHQSLRHVPFPSRRPSE